MFGISILQALHIWSQLEQALYEDHPYGGDTAEIGVYQLLACTPDRPQPAPQDAVVASDEEIIGASRDLYQLLRIFASERGVAIQVDDEALGKGMITSDCGPCWYVQVRSPGRDYEDESEDA